MASTWGENIKLSIFGGSHTEAIGVVLDNLPPNEKIDMEKIRVQMARRAPGKDIANPIATILSAAMMLRYTFDLDKEADAIEAAVKQVLKDGYRTIDIMPQEDAKKAYVTQVGTSQMGDLICERI